MDWGGWEVSHASPAADPSRYQQTEGVLLSHGFNRAYTVGLSATFELFRGPSGLAVVRHHALNEDMMFGPDGRPKLGYFVADMERAGPYCMLAEAWAMAYGDPRYMGYLVGLNFNRGFPQFAREFNTAFLSLPALPSRRLSGVADDPDIVVRAIPTREHGTYWAVINTGLTAKTNAVLRWPAQGPLADAVTGEPVALAEEGLRLSLQPCQLRALRRRPAVE